MNRHNLIVPALIGAVAQIAVDRFFPLTATDVNRLANDQLRKDDVLVRGALPLGLAGAAGLATSNAKAGVAFLLGELAVTLVTGGSVVMVSGLPVFTSKQALPAMATSGGVVDLGPHGAAGFAWDSSNGMMYTINEGELVATGVGSIAAAVQKAKEWFG